MERRSLFKRIFKSEGDNKPSTITSVKFLDGNDAKFTTYDGDIINDPDVRACIDAIARNGAKMHPRHIRNSNGNFEDLKDDIYRLLAKQPNELQNAYQFYYQVISNLFLNNDSIIYIEKDLKKNVVTALYPLQYFEEKLYEYYDKKQDKTILFLKFKFGNGKERYVPYSRCIHLTRFATKEGVFGGSKTPIVKTLSMKHIMDEGIINAIKTTASIKGLLKSTKALLKPSDVKAMRDKFIENFMDADNKTGIGALDATTEFIPVKIEPTTANDTQIKEISDKVLSYFGVNTNILQSKYSEDEWNAFYESVLEPIGLQMSLEFTNKLFTPRELDFGNEIVYESNRLQYASNATKINLLRYANNIMTLNELREVFNLAPREGGDVILIDQNHSVMDEEGGNQNEGEGN